MKRLLTLGLVLACTTWLVGCDKKVESISSEDNTKYEFEGVVNEVRDGEFDFAYLSGTMYDHMIVITDEKVEEGDHVYVTTTGAMMMSEPPKVNATEIKINNDENIEDKILRDFELNEIIDDEYIIVTKYVHEGEDLEPKSYKVNYKEAKINNELKVGDRYNIKFDGNMTRSLPPIINAEVIEFFYED